MEHEGEIWQEYDCRGVPIMDGGRPSSKGNNDETEPNVYGTGVVWLYRRYEFGVEVLFSQRPKNIDYFGGAFDASAGGHVNYQELPPDAAMREVKEEIGVELDAEKLEFVFSFNNRSKIQFVYAYDFSDEKQDFVLNPTEAAKVKWVKLQDFRKFWQKNMKASLIDNDGYCFLLEEWLKKKQEKYGTRR